jgi:hypothetical protein
MNPNQYTEEELARALYDHQNSLFQMPYGATWDHLIDRCSLKYIDKARELIRIMEGYRK